MALRGRDIRDYVDDQRFIDAPMNDRIRGNLRSGVSFLILCAVEALRTDTTAILTCVGECGVCRRSFAVQTKEVAVFSELLLEVVREGAGSFLCTSSGWNHGGFPLAFVRGSPFVQSFQARGLALPSMEELLETALANPVPDGLLAPVDPPCTVHSTGHAEIRAATSAAAQRLLELLR
jgi:hypothetical protein